MWTGFAAQFPGMFAVDAEFSIHCLVVEDGQTGTLMAPTALTMDGDASMGDIMAGQSVVLRMRDLVSITDMR